MEITTKKELEFCMKADYMMSHGTWEPSLLMRIRWLIGLNPIEKYLRLMRKVNYYSHSQRLSLGGVLFEFYKYRYSKLGLKLGFSIGYKTFGYGLVIPHYGTIVIGADNRCGNYCVLHTSTCITGGPDCKKIGDGLYLSTGVRIVKRISLANNVQVASNSVVNKTYVNNNILLAGMPAEIKKEVKPWYQGWEAELWHKHIENLRDKLGLRLF